MEEEVKKIVRSIMICVLENKQIIKIKTRKEK